MDDNKKVTCDICNHVKQEGVMGFDGCSLICRNKESKYYGEEIGYFDCKECSVGETNVPYNKP